MIELLVVNDEILKYGLPSRETAGAAGYDLRACIKEPIILNPETTIKIPTGVAVHIKNRSLAGFVMPRSGLASKFQITLQNAVGLIDSDYQGELQVLLRNEGRDPYRINVGDRIAQLVFAPVAHPVLSVVTNFSSDSERGDQGFGSTGVASRRLADGPNELNAPGAVLPTQLVGNDDDIMMGEISSVAPRYEPTSSEILESTFGD